MSNRSTPLDQLPSVANPNPMPSMEEQTENAKLVQDVLNEVEMSRQSAETGFMPQATSQYSSHQMSQVPQQTGGYVKSSRPSAKSSGKESSFLGVTISDIKQMIIVFSLFLLLNLQFIIDLIGKYLIFSQHDDGFTTILGIIFRGAILMLLFLIIKKVF